MTTYDIVQPVINEVYGNSDLAGALINSLTSMIDAGNTENREEKIKTICWNHFSGGSTAESVAKQIEQTLIDEELDGWEDAEKSMLD